MNIDEPSNQAMGARKEQTRNEREISESPDWVMTLEAEDYLIHDPVWGINQQKFIT